MCRSKSSLELMFYVDDMPTLNKAYLIYLILFMMIPLFANGTKQAIAQTVLFTCTTGPFAFRLRFSISATNHDAAIASGVFPSKVLGRMKRSSLQWDYVYRGWTLASLTPFWQGAQFRGSDIQASLIRTVFTKRVSNVTSFSIGLRFIKELTTYDQIFNIVLLLYKWK